MTGWCWAAGRGGHTRFGSSFNSLLSVLQAAHIPGLTALAYPQWLHIVQAVSACCAADVGCAAGRLLDCLAV